MASKDLAQYIRERMALFDSTIDTSSGSDFDAKVVQPTVSRLGADPFVMDLQLFAKTRLQQEHPTYFVEEGSALIDLLIKPFSVFLEPLIRENRRIANGQSLTAPELLTTEEAEALGSRTYSVRDTGDISKGTVRLYFTSPRSVSVSGSNYAFTADGLRYFPTQSQSIRSEEMITNVENGLYYFDVRVQAEQAGSGYNINAGKIVGITGIAGAVKTTNKVKFRGGLPAENPSEFISRVQQEVTDRSLASDRGAKYRILNNFPEVQSIALIGYQDPEMQRDIITGGGLGKSLASGVLAASTDDGEAGLYTRRILLDASEVDLVALVGSTGSAPDGYVITLYNAFEIGSSEKVRDLKVRSIISSQLLEVEEQVLRRYVTDIPWTLRKRELTLSSLPGGIVFGEGGDFITTSPSTEIHIGGMYDAYVKGESPNESSLAIGEVRTRTPLLSGIAATVPVAGSVSLDDLVLGTNYASVDKEYEYISDSYLKRYVLEVSGDPAVAGTYKIVSVTQPTIPGDSPIFTLIPTISAVAGNFAWKLIDTIDVDLFEPKVFRLSNTDLQTVGSSTIVKSGSGIDFDAYGVSAGDTLRILSGGEPGDYTITAIAPFFNTLTLDRSLTQNNSGLSYEIFKKNSNGGIKLPLVRIKRVELLDTSSQPTGSTIPYAKALKAKSLGFANVAQGTKVSVTDASLGIVGIPITGPVAGLNGLPLRIKLGVSGSDFNSTTYGTLVSVFFTGASLTLAQIVEQINDGLVALNYPPLAVVVDGDRLGILPYRGGCCVFLSGNAPSGAYSNFPAVLTALFGSATYKGTTRDIRSAYVSGLTGRWSSSTISPVIDPTIDAADVLNGYNPKAVPVYKVTTRELTNDVLEVKVGGDFNPQVDASVNVGSRSLGTARVYFLEPTSAEFDQETRLTASLEDGSEVTYLPDPTVDAIRIPAPPYTAAPKDGSTTALGTTLTSATTDFISKGIQPGDKLQITYVPIIGTVALTEEVLNLALTQIVVSLNGGTPKTITLVNDSTSILATSVTRAGVASQINSSLGVTVAYINALTNKLEFEADIAVSVLETGSANTLLGFSTLSPQSNTATNAGLYKISAVNTNTVTIQDSIFAVTAQRQHFLVYRAETQRISSTEMANNKENGFYYFDLEVVSEGVGNRNNIPSETFMDIEKYRSDGYWLETNSESLTFSTAERPTLFLSRTMLEVGSSDDYANVRQLEGTSIQIVYEHSELVSSIQSFLLADDERVPNANPLARHLIPHYVSFNLSYTGGPQANTVQSKLIDYVSASEPNQAIEVAAIESMAKQAGATTVKSPTTVYAVIHDIDRRVYLEASQDRLSIGRLASFFADSITATRG